MCIRYNWQTWGSEPGSEVWLRNPVVTHYTPLPQQELPRAVGRAESIIYRSHHTDEKLSIGLSPLTCALPLFSGKALSNRQDKTLGFTRNFSDAEHTREGRDQTDKMWKLA